MNNADVILEKLSNVMTSDAIILNQCESWFNLVEDIVKEKLPTINYIDLR